MSQRDRPILDTFVDMGLQHQLVLDVPAERAYVYVMHGALAFQRNVFRGVHV